MLREGDRSCHELNKALTYQCACNPMEINTKSYGYCFIGIFEHRTFRWTVITLIRGYVAKTWDFTIDILMIFCILPTKTEAIAKAAVALVEISVGVIQVEM